MKDYIAESWLKMKEKGDRSSLKESGEDMIGGGDECWWRKEIGWR